MGAQGVWSQLGASQRHSDTTTQRHSDTTTQRHNDTTTQRHNDTTTKRHNDTTTQRHNDTTTQRHNNEGRRTKDEGRRTKDEGRRTKDEGRTTDDRRTTNDSTTNERRTTTLIVIVCLPSRRHLSILATVYITFHSFPKLPLTEFSHINEISSPTEASRQYTGITVHAGALRSLRVIRSLRPNEQRTEPRHTLPPSLTEKKPRPHRKTASKTREKHSNSHEVLEPPNTSPTTTATLTGS